MTSWTGGLVQAGAEVADVQFFQLWKQQFEVAGFRVLKVEDVLEQH